MSTTDAEAAAWGRATERGADRVVIHDRYHRIRLIDVTTDDAARAMCSPRIYESPASGDSVAIGR